MDFDDPRDLAIFLDVYGTLPRAGPGSDELTLRALELVPSPTPNTVLDLGCGPGAQTVALAGALPEARVVAIDLLPAMVEKAGRRVAELGLGDRVEVIVGDMADPTVAAGSQDLIWSEGAIYNVGVTEALRCWRPLLADRGTVVFSEPVWLVESPPTEILDWWSSEYPAITDAGGLRSRIEAASFAVVDSFPLPASAWWDGYYGPMLTRIDDLKTRRPDDETAGEIVAMAETEIEHFRRFSDSYSYAFFVVQPND